MKNFTFLMVSLLILTPLHARTFGLGVTLGDPTGLSGKYFMNRQTAIDGAIAYGSHELILYGDYLKHFPGAFGRQNEFVSQLNPYVGVGPVFAFGDGNHDHKHRFMDDDDDDFAFGGRIPLGIEWLPNNVPLGVSLEIAPGMRIVPGTDAFVQGGLAIRYYFK